MARLATVLEGRALWRSDQSSFKVMGCVRAIEEFEFSLFDTLIDVNLFVLERLVRPFLADFLARPPDDFIFIICIWVVLADRRFAEQVVCCGHVS
ncbi:MAG: hypothetical protein NT077_01210 [Candidatus Taylorbacteria bacterium]|nr:hypothetical protein [Candidatus Taylorbacteria bacterium]